MDIKISDLESGNQMSELWIDYEMIADDLEKWRQNIIREVDKFTENHSAIQ